MRKINSKKNRRPFKTRFIAYIVATLDGKISKHKKTRPDWTSREDWEFFQSELAKCDAVVVGRNTYEAAAEYLRRRNTFVLTGRVKSRRCMGNVSFVNPEHFKLREIFGFYGKVGVVGGARVFSYMLNNGLLDEAYITFEPVIFGKGLEMFEDLPFEKRLKLLNLRRLNKSGTVLLHYRFL